LTYQRGAFGNLGGVDLKNKLLPLLTNMKAPNVPLLEVKNLGKRFGRAEVLSGISFSIFAREIIGVIGPNGAGKTTLLECLAGLLPYENGTVTWQSSHLNGKSRKDDLFCLPDGIIPYARQRVHSVIGFYREAFGASMEHERKVVAQLELGPVTVQRTGELSKGYRRRLLLAIALLTRRPLLLLDEPFDGFDLRQVLNVMAILREVIQEGRTLVLSIHQLLDAARICDRFLLLTNGRLLGAGTLEELQDKAGKNGANLEEVFLALT
jgi:ABC-2 type transport system ATP-binding protein